MTFPENAPDSGDRPVVLVTGSSGHLGTALILMLPIWGFEVIGLDILPCEHTHIVGSVNDGPLVAKILAAHNISHIVHTATLHKPHVGTHAKQQFIDTNIAGTLTLLEEAAKLKDQIQSFVFFSTTSTFGSALSPKPGTPAIWIDEQVACIPKNIYGVTKLAAEELCEIMHQEHGIPIVILRTSRFFTEQDDDDERRNSMGDENLKVLEMAYRRVDMEDVVGAAVCALRAKHVVFGKFIISAPPPFPNDPEILKALDQNPAAVLAKYVPSVTEVWAKKHWKHLARIDRIYDSSKAVSELGWTPKWTFDYIVKMILSGRRWRSELVNRVGQRGYHAVTTGVYTKR